MEHVLKETTGEEYDHSNDLGIKGGTTMDAIGTREQVRMRKRLVCAIMLC
jgi:hypothetical protein